MESYETNHHNGHLLDTPHCPGKDIHPAAVVLLMTSKPGIPIQTEPVIPVRVIMDTQPVLPVQTEPVIPVREIMTSKPAIPVQTKEVIDG